MGLLGEKSLDLTPGSIKEPTIPPEGLVVSVEPLDITQLLARAAPSLDDVQKVLTNLVSITEGMAGSESDFNKIFSELKSIVCKINAGKGSLGQLVNDPSLYRDTAETMAQVRQFIGDVEKSKGLLGTLVNDPAFKERAVKTMTELQGTFANLNKTTADLRDVSARLPDMAKKLDGFLANLNRAGKGLPGLVTQGESAFSDVDTTTKAIQRSWLLRRYVPQPQEHTIRLDGEPGKD
jgi:ABC-type transporter Mla subunit MlaD